MSLKKIILPAFIFLILTSISWAGKINERWTVTATERFRLETWDNAITLDKYAEASRCYTRSRSQLGAVWSPMPELTFGLRLANEFRYHITPTSTDFNLDEIFIDHLYLKFIPPNYHSLIITIGRQDIILGEGFIMMDGGPLDGSRSIYFNAIRLDWNFHADQTLTAFVCHQKATDEWLPVIHEQDQALIEQPETGLGVYYSGKWSQRELQGYVIHKKLDETESYPLGSKTTTIGGRIKQRLLSDIDLAAVMEAGYQFGSYGDYDSRKALGGYAYLRYCPGWKNPRAYLPTIFSAGVIYLSGDDPATDDLEAWDPMFARWPKWSESYIYTQIKEDAVAWWTNLISINSEAQFLLTPQVDLKITYHHLTAPKRDASIMSEFPGGSGKKRGDLFIGIISYKFDRYWSGHLLCECFSPGDYYFDDADNYAWIRLELMFKY